MTKARYENMQTKHRAKP